MAWTGVWEISVDGVNLNDGVLYISMVPEIENTAPMDVVLAPRDGDYPVFIRSQPQAGTYSILIAVKGGIATLPAWNTRMAALRALFTPNSYHTLTVKVRGMADPKSVQFIVEGLQADFRSKTVIVNAVAPNPNLV